MISTEDVYSALGITEQQALEFLNKYTFGSNELNDQVSIVRFAACFAFEFRHSSALNTTAELDRLKAVNADLLKSLESWRKAEEYSDRYADVADAKDDINEAWVHAIWLRNAAIAKATGVNHE